jgi:transposase
MMSGSSSPMPEQVVTTHVVGIDIGMESCTMSCLTMDKRQVIKATPFANSVQGFDWLFERLEGLGVARKEILVGLEATSRYGENLLQALLKHGYQVCLLHPAQMHAEASQRGMRARNGSARCHDDRASVDQRRSALRLRAQ